MTKYCNATNYLNPFVFTPPKGIIFLFKRKASTTVIKF